MKKTLVILVVAGILTGLLLGGKTTYAGSDSVVKNSSVSIEFDFAKVEKNGSRLADLKGQYPGITTIDGWYDNDVIFAAVCDALDRHDEQLVIYRNTGEIVRNFEKFKAVSNYQYFWLEGINSTDYSDYSVMTFRYLYNEEETEKMINEIDTVYRDIQYELKNYSNDEWKMACYIYNYLVRTVTYSKKEHKDMRNIYGALVEHDAVCTGYAAAFDYIMSRMGFDVGVAGNANHIWNYMAWDSDDCFIDVTWGDPDIYDYYNNHFIDFSYMGLDYSELQALDDHELDYAYISGREYERCDVKKSELSGSQNRNYCDISGFNADTYSYEKVEDILRSQYALNENSLIVRFNSAEELVTAADILTANGCETLNWILSDLGYCGSYYYDHNEACKTFLVKVRPQE